MSQQRQPSAGRMRKPIEVGGELAPIMEQQQMSQARALERPSSAAANRTAARPTSANRTAARARPPSGARERTPSDIDPFAAPKPRPVSAGVYRSSASFTDRPTS